LIKIFDNELKILLKITKENLLGKGFDTKLVELIIKNREGKIKVIPGYDGEYGKAVLGEKQAALI
jgi:PHP family Zn ribbon phosphoesterase